MNKEESINKIIEEFKNINFSIKSLIYNGVVEKEIFTFDNYHSKELIEFHAKCIAKEAGMKYLENFLKNEPFHDLKNYEDNFFDGLEKLATGIALQLRLIESDRLKLNSSLDFTETLNYSSLGGKLLESNGENFFTSDTFFFQTIYEKIIETLNKKNFAFELHSRAISKGIISIRNTKDEIVFLNSGIDQFLAKVFDFFTIEEKKNRIQGTREDFIALFRNPSAVKSPIFFERPRDLKFIVEKIFEKKFLKEDHGLKTKLYNGFKNGKIQFSGCSDINSINNKIESIRKATFSSKESISGLHRKFPASPPYKADFTIYTNY